MPLAIILLGLLALAPMLRADDARLVRVGEFWRYFKGTSEPAGELGAWRLPGYNDTNWLVGRSGFATFSGWPEPTALNDYGLAYRTMYFRKGFQVKKAGDLADLILRIDYDDGFIAYLNGQEVARRGVAGAPGDLAPREALANLHARAFQVEEISLAGALPLLVDGTNLLAVQLLGSSTNDYVCALALELFGNFQRGPFLQNTTETSTLVIWKTVAPAPSFIEYGTNRAVAARQDLEAGQTNHVAALTNLLPGTAYEYRVASEVNGKTVYSDWSNFRTFKTEGKISFIVVGDTGYLSEGQFAVAEAMRRTPVDLILHTGDMSYGAFSLQMADFRCLSVYADQFRTTPFFATLGNHDLPDRNAALHTFHFPTNTATGTEHYYSFDHGDAHFAVAWSDLPVGADYRPGGPQYQWLSADLARTTKPWKFLIFHHTWRTTSIHTHDDYDVNFVRDSLQIDDGLISAARKHGVQIVFNGHDHCYERLKPLGGPMSFVSGGGGAGLYGFSSAHPDSVQFHIRHHFLKVELDRDEAYVEAITPDGKVLDRVHVRRVPPERKEYAAAWHKPEIESAPANNLDGNIIGQRFDFAGVPITGTMGQFSSAGRLFVNNDKEHLYLGFDEVMLGAGEELYVFLEVPGLNGVASLDGLGNGVIDPEGEGADGLDFMGNLAFTNFSPAVGLILGDEFGDYLYRSFVRPPFIIVPTNTPPPINTGQGAFYLSGALPEVPGQHLAQFNRSPQDLPVSYEQNADLIEVSIPYASLGGLKPGDLIRVGAIVALKGIDPSPLIETRQLDLGGLGFQIVSNASRILLEGIPIRLAIDPDPDGDGLTTDEEIALGTNPNLSDTDGDGLPDGWERQFLFNPLSSPGAGEREGDPDGDGLVNFREWELHSSPRLADTDTDGLPDGWEANHGLSPASPLGINGPLGDPDQDRANNLQEFRAGTHPRDALSRFSVQAALAGADELKISWAAAPGKKYNVQFRDGVSGTFTEVIAPGFPRVAQNAEESVVLPLAPGDAVPVRFYRIQLIIEQ